MSIPRSFGAHVLERAYRTVQMSFESGQQNTARLYFNERVRILRLRGEVTKAIAATDNGTLTPRDSSSNTMTGGTLTATASDALNTRYTGTPAANNVVNAGSYMELVAAKTTAGGAVQVFVEYEVAP